MASAALVPAISQAALPQAQAPSRGEGSTWLETLKNYGFDLISLFALALCALCLIVVKGDMVSSTKHGIWLSQCPVPCHINTVLGDAQSCQNLPDPKNQKPAITRAPGHFLLDRARQCRTSNHSHSIVAGGLLDTSYVTREMPSISLMMRPETVSSSSYGRCAQRAVMKSMVSTARRATTQA